MIEANEFWSVTATPAFVVYSPTLNSSSAGFVFLKAEILNKLYPWSAELNPSPEVPDFLIPSTKIFSPTVNGAVVNPDIGVTRTQVTSPTVEEIQLLIPTPLLLLIA